MHCGHALAVYSDAQQCEWVPSHRVQPELPWSLSFSNKGLIKGGSAWHTQSTIIKVETAYSVFVDAGFIIA